MDSSDDDKPIAQLAARAMHSKPSSAPAAMTIPKQAVRTAPAAPGAKRPAAEIDSDDDDVPLAVLMKRKLEAAQKTTMKTPSKMIKTAPPPKKAKVDMSSKNPSRKAKDAKSSKKSKAKPSKSSRSSAASAVGQSSRVSVYYESEKGKVVQALMLRWWYAIQWPELNTRMTVPPGYESLDGFPGVFVGTRVSSMHCAPPLLFVFSPLCVLCSWITSEKSEICVIRARAPTSRTCGRRAPKNLRGYARRYGKPFVLVQWQVVCR